MTLSDMSEASPTDDVELLSVSGENAQAQVEALLLRELQTAVTSSGLRCVAIESPTY